MNDIGRQLGRAAHDSAASAAADATRHAKARPDFAAAVDVAYAEEDSPFGRLLLAATPRGLVRIAYTATARGDDLVEDLAERVSPRVVELPARVDEVRRQLDDYFAGRRRSFELAIDWRLARGFGRRVLEATAAIPYGETASYAQVARRAGSVRGYRAAGNALNRNPVPIVVPCHRVLQTGGGLGGYGGGLDAKERLLRLEGALANG